MAVHKYLTIDLDDYLTLDRNSKNARHEYLDGELRMLAGEVITTQHAHGGVSP